MENVERRLKKLNLVVGRTMVFSTGYIAKNIGQKAVTELKKADDKAIETATHTLRLKCKKRRG